MDLIYMDANRVELGVLQHYTLDLDIAKDKDFEIRTLDDETLLESGYWWYIAGTEYGGRIDKVSHDTKAKTVTYYGRNWRGILDSKIIEPLNGATYVYAEGGIVDSIQSILEHCEYDNLFMADGEKIDGEIPAYQYPRYCTLYEGLNGMLDNANCKLRMEYSPSNARVMVSAGLIVDHSDYLTYISENSLNFVITQKKGGVNHLLCLGQGDGDNRAVLHLFVDEVGMLQPYRLTENPVRNSDYILDKRHQQIFGVDERAAVYDYPNAQITYNYVLLPIIPLDWLESYKKYYKIDEAQQGEDLSSSRYKAVEPDIIETYTALSSQPGDWATNYNSYYVFNGEEYERAAEYTGEPEYERLYRAPDDWATNYNSYYYYHNDGTGATYHSVGSASNDKYHKQTTQPSDWSVNYKNYYMLEIDDTPAPKKKYEKVTGSTAPTWKKSTYFKKSGTSYTVTTKKPSDWATNYRNYYILVYELNAITTSVTGFASYIAVKPTASGKAPTWKQNKYYTRESLTVAPTFETVINGGEYYCRKVVKTNMPPFEKDKYYKYEKVEKAPEFVSGTYYEKAEDWYKVLAEGGIERLADLNRQESQTVTLAELQADIGDIVSGYDLITGVSVNESVTNIIVKIKNDVITLDYEVGGTT